MELWVRSQDKNALYCVRQLRINGLDIMCLGGELLGTYKTRERALEVLNEIQEMDFKSNSNVKLTSYGYVYEMPKE